MQTDKRGADASSSASSSAASSPDSSEFLDARGERDLSDSEADTSSSSGSSSGGGTQFTRFTSAKVQILTLPSPPLRSLQRPQQRPPAGRCPRKKQRQLIFKCRFERILLCQARNFVEHFRVCLCPLYLCALSFFLFLIGRRIVLPLEMSVVLSHIIPAPGSEVCECV